MTLETAISHYGYWVLLAGTFLEGETILIISGYMAHLGYLDLPVVILAAFVGSWAGDQLFFHLGRSRGAAYLDRHRYWKEKSAAVFAMMNRHPLPLVMGFRFLLGLRTVTPFAIGMSGFGPFRFLLLNGIGAIAWAIVVGCAGYLFGQAVSPLVSNIKRYELAAAGIVALVGGAVWAIHFFRRRAAGAPRESLYGPDGEVPLPGSLESRADASAATSKILLLLAEKRTSLATLRAGITVFVLPLSVLSLLIATSKFYRAVQAMDMLVPLAALNLSAIAVGSYLVVRSVRQIHRYDRQMSRLKKIHRFLAEVMD